ncbi:Arsenical pump membrane protein [Colletotrichum sidae]|uniref:Arsenical pump membrane protein n=1 Tax=Colletotrichum sidae TaxID=1347389 RepID=A0A4R8T4H6_9PEZI|nr:Arsenical pump membrane protein [Colletotrichum sidae]
MNSVTAPLIADLFLLAILAIGRKEVHDGTIGEGGIFPLDIMIFFITLAYIAISIDASGLIRYLALKVLQWGGEVGHRLFFYLYAFFFGLGVFIGNDPIILSGTAFLSYMTRVSNNIAHPRAWIFTQFAIANIASAILVSSNPTNLVLAGAFNIKFIEYTANMVVPVVITAIVLFPFLLYIIFANEGLIPVSIQMRELPAEAKSKPVNPNIPNARGSAAEEENNPGNEEEGKLLSLVEIMNPFLDKGGAAFGAVIMSATLITVLALNAASVKPKDNEHLQVFWVTLPAAFVMLCWDLTFGWLNREETRQIARKGREDLERARLERGVGVQVRDSYPLARAARGSIERGTEMSSLTRDYPDGSRKERPIHDDDDVYDVRADLKCSDYDSPPETFPTVMAVISHLPFALVPFAFAMFVLVQALVTKGWVPVFAHGWDHWVEKTGTIGAIGGMGFLSVILCNFAGTNIGTTILLSRVIQTWQAIHQQNGIPISDRTFWATVYSMALGVNYGAFSTAFSASLAGLLWRDILERKHIHIRRLEFARVNVPIIAIAMTVGCTVLVGEIYIIRKETPYHM